MFLGFWARFADRIGPPVTAHPPTSDDLMAHLLNSEGTRAQRRARRGRQEILGSFARQL